jgi:3-oxoacyl-[acyl-carrier protein] reductase
MFTLQGKTALVTGASRGIGRATAAALARAGAHVLVHYGRSAQEAESLVSEIQAKGGRAEAISADLGTPNGSALLAKQVRAIVGDRLDVLVLNAGISKAARLADYAVGILTLNVVMPAQTNGAASSDLSSSGMRASARASAIIISA